ncbi:MAG: type II secretion system F family protein [Catonella sp.]|uniref:type II secretion system F family protein n=1 Tax=Catonella sp. TaxID=2382125 RepID=UPI003FA02424
MEAYRAFDKKQKLIILISLLLTVLGIVAGLIYDSRLKNEEVKKFIRPKSYENPTNISFELEVDGVDTDEKINYTGQVDVKKLSENEIDNYLNKALEETEKNMFREGESKEKVITGINIEPKLPENPVDISFSTDESEVLFENGDINFELVKEKRKVIVKILTSYEEREKEKYIDIIVFPKALTEEERLKNAVTEKINLALLSSENEIVEIPNEVEGHMVRAFFPKKEITGSIAGFAIVLIICLFVVFNEDNKKKIKEREEELKNGYTEFVGRFVILLGAGLGILAVWKKLEKGFTSNKSLNEEIRFTLWEIGNGKTEREAYENFGRRIGGTQYAKFVSVINQSLKLGSGQLLKRLEAESEAAMFERRNNAKVMGEVADTKLLLPMMIQLVLIMLVIMVPAIMAV